MAHRPFLTNIDLWVCRPNPLIFSAGLGEASRIQCGISHYITVEGKHITSNMSQRLHVRMRRAAGRLEASGVPCGSIKYPIDSDFRQTTKAALGEIATEILLSISLALNSYQHRATAINFNLDYSEMELAGETIFYPEGRCDIKINLNVIRGWTDFVDTILHELAHVLHGTSPDYISDGHCVGWQETFAWLVLLASKYYTRRLASIKGKMWLASHAERISVYPCQAQ